MKLPSEGPGAKRAWRGESAEVRQEQRRQRLMDAALAAFARHGVAKTTMRDICAESRLTERYFYEVFRSTEDAFDIVYGQLRQQLIARVSQAMAAAPMEMEAIAREGLRAFYLFIQEDPRRAQIMLIDAFSANQRSLSTSLNTLSEYVALMRGLAASLCPKLSPDFDMEMLASGLLGMAIQVATTWASQGYKQPLDTVLDFNLYAWRGLGGWIKQMESAPKPLAPAAPSA